MEIGGEGNGRRFEGVELKLISSSAAHFIILGRNSVGTLIRDNGYVFQIISTKKGILRKIARV